MVSPNGPLVFFDKTLLILLYVISVTKILISIFSSLGASATTGFTNLQIFSFLSLPSFNADNRSISWLIGLLLLIIEASMDGFNIGGSVLRDGIENEVLAVLLD